MASHTRLRNYRRREGDIPGDRDSCEGYGYEPTSRGVSPLVTNFEANWRTARRLGVVSKSWPPNSSTTYRGKLEERSPAKQLLLKATGSPPTLFPLERDCHLDVAVLLRRAHDNRVILDPHRSNAPGIGWAECPVAVTNQIIGRLVPEQGVSYLTCDPLSGRI